MLEQIDNHVWTLAVRLRNWAKRSSALGPIEPVLLKIGPRLIRAPRTEVVVRLGGGMTMRIPPGYPAARSFASGQYEPDVTRLFQRIIRTGMTVVDAGANVGYYSLLACESAGPTGRIYAFEPDPLNFSYLVQNLEANNCSTAQAAEVALSDSTRIGKFIRDAQGAEGFLTAESNPQAALEVSVDTLDRCLEKVGWPSVDLIKLDIEGSELSALEGMRQVNLRNPQLQLIMELNLSATARAGASSE